MTLELILGDRAYSSWSLRIWLLIDRFDLNPRIRHISLADGTGTALLQDHHPAKTVPTLILPDGTAISESLAITEELADRHPAAAIWPADPPLRAIARMLCAEMHAGFPVLRSSCPMNLRAAYAPSDIAPELGAELGRLADLWAHAFNRSGGPWLCGAWSAADAFFAPVAARIATYGLSVPDGARSYVARQLADPGFRRWRAMSLVAGPILTRYDLGRPAFAWPGPSPEPAETASGPARNAACPYSGRPVTHHLRTADGVWGLCNAFCRDKTLADPGAWPAFAAMRAAVNRT